MRQRPDSNREFPKERVLSSIKDSRPAQFSASNEVPDYATLA